MAITRGTVQMARRMHRDIGTEVDDTVRALTRSWVDTWDSLASGWQQAAEQLTNMAVRLGRWPRPNEIARTDQVDQAVRRSRDALDQLTGRVETLTTDGVDRVVQLDAEREARLIASQAPEGEQPGLTRLLTDRGNEPAVEALREAARDEVETAVQTRIRTDAIDRITARTGEQIHADTLPLSQEAVDSMRRELVRGIDVGDNPRPAARRMVDNVQDRFNGGLTRAMTIARTEMLDAYRSTSQAIHEENQDLVTAWEWLATLGSRTCPSCLALHGTRYPANTPGPQDHPQGRCARLPVLASWEELGISAPEPDDAVPDAQAWFDRQPRATQLAVMGPARLDMLEQGRVSWADLPTRRENPRWRPSYVPTPVRDLQRRAARGDTAAAPPSPAAAGQPPSPAQQIADGDFTSLDQIGPALGSNPGGLFQATDGSQWYVKTLDEAHARNEALASGLYRAAGIRTPETHLGRGAAGAAAETGQMQIASRLVPDASAVTGPDAVQQQLREGFGVDAWLANWDVSGAGWDNVVTSGGDLWRIDLGGSLRYRARGAAKGNAFGAAADEWVSLRDAGRAPVAAQAFAGMTRAELVTAIERVQAVQPDTIRQLVRQNGLDNDLAQLLVDRREHLTGLLPKLRSEAARQETFSQAAAQAVTGQQALDAANRQADMQDMTIVPPPSNFSTQQLRVSSDAVGFYRGAGYSTVNGRLRDTQGQIDQSSTVQGLDAILDVSNLKRNVLAYRGVRDPQDFIDSWNQVDVVGLTWTDHGYSSVSANDSIAQGFGSGDDGVFMRVVVPRDMPAMQLSNMEEEAEILLRRGITFRVVADHGVVTTEQHGVVDRRRRIDVEVVTQ